MKRENAGSLVHMQRSDRTSARFFGLIDTLVRAVEPTQTQFEGRAEPTPAGKPQRGPHRADPGSRHPHAGRGAVAHLLRGTVNALPAPRKPTLAQRALELRSLAWPGASLTLLAGRELQYRFAISPSVFGRKYECLLAMKPDSRMPVMLVLKPDLVAIAGGRLPPHVYPHSGPGVSLCLWWPKRREWLPQMKLADTYLPWTAEWLWYFEDWLVTGQWAGGGEHPPPRRSRSTRIRRHATEMAAA